MCYTRPNSYATAAPLVMGRPPLATTGADILWLPQRIVKPRPAPRNCQSFPQLLESPAENLLLAASRPREALLCQGRRPTVHKLEVTAREKVLTQSAPMNEDAGRLVANEAIQFAGIAGASLAIGSVCVLIAQASLGGDTFDPAPLRWLRGFGLLLGASGGLLGFGFAGLVLWLTIRGWVSYQERLERWHFAHLAAYEAAGGQQSERELKITSLSLAEPLHVLAVALAVVDKHNETGRITWSGPALRGDVWIGRLRVGDLGKADAEQFSTALSTLGLVRGRKAGAAGQLVTNDLAEALQLVKRNYGKLRPGEISRPEPEVNGDE
jgi:hypothetical protein